MTKYITTPIYYVNGNPHIGSAYPTVIADVMNRYFKLFGEESFFLTGTDEHGQKVQQAAELRGLTPQAHVDEMHVHFETAWKRLGIDYDIFMRTTYPFHVDVVQQALQKLFDKGDIYLHEYEGWYSVSEEMFYTEKDLVNGKSPVGKEVQKITEKNYFFRMSNYQQTLLDYIDSHPQFLQPEGKKSETIGFLKQPLQDLCISRTKARLSWGIELPFDKEFVTYVWFDALLNYCSAIGLYQGEEKQEQFDKFWPNAIHLIGKDILITHTIYWTTMLFALELPQPRTIFAHGWWLNETGDKMAKSEGKVVTPLEMIDLVGAEPFRYFLCREIVFGNDASFAPEIVVNRINSELANNFGNLVSRVFNLIHKYFDGKIPDISLTLAESRSLSESAVAAPALLKEKIYGFEPQAGLGVVIDLLSETNRYIDAHAPWKAAKDNPSLAAETLYCCLEVIRISSILLSPVMPQKCALILEWLGVPTEKISCSALEFRGLQAGLELPKIEPVFPRIDVKAA